MSAAGSLAAGTTVAVFTATDDGLEDGVTYAATVYAINDEGEAASNEEDVTTNFFPWDENFPTSLHEGGWGKTTFYNAVPNRGFATKSARWCGARFSTRKAPQGSTGPGSSVRSGAIPG